MPIARRDLLCGLLAAPLRAAAFDLRGAPSAIDPPDAGLELTRRWSGGLCRARLANRGKRAVRVKQATLFRIEHKLPERTRLYGESFQMLSQTGGTLGRPLDLAYDERKHYRLPQPEDAKAVSSLLTLTPPGGPTRLLAFTSSHRFHGRFFVRPGSIEVVMDTEGLELGPGEAWEMEEFLYAEGASRPALLARLAARINRNHPPLRFPAPPAGWCSWYCFGPKVTAQNVRDNLQAIMRDTPTLKYVQIDDGYQPAMGDWLETGKAFGGDIRGVLREIRERGFEPAIWVAPFIAEAGSNLFREHPEWFMRGADGKPLPANAVTFGGWRRGPWYALDGTHPEALRHLERLFGVMRREWGVTYFKLDANFWGAMHGARLHDAKATRIEAYRRGMQAVLRGAGDAFLLGCNHPIWGSLGLIHGSRSSDDISRQWAKFERVTRQNLSRNWQNGTLWWNDPDAITLSGEMPENEYRYHATGILATGGMALSGDDLTKLPPARLAMLKKLLPPSGVAAEFEDETLRVGVTRLKDRALVCVFNPGDTAATIAVRLPRAGRVTDFWTGAELGRRSGSMNVELGPHSATALEVR